MSERNLNLGCDQFWRTGHKHPMVQLKSWIFLAATIHSDSQYLVDAIMKGWAVAWKKKDWWLNNKERAKNIDLWQKLLPLCETHQVEFRWVKATPVFRKTNGAINF